MKPIASAAGALNALVCEVRVTMVAVKHAEWAGEILNVTPALDLHIVRSGDVLEPEVHRLRSQIEICGATTRRSLRPMLKYGRC